MNLLRICPLIGIATALLTARLEAATLRIQANETIHPVSRYLTGACIEDVNHEVYGGIDSQMIFGESFAEPAPPQPLKGFKAFGDWSLEADGVRVVGGEGAKLVANAAAVSEGEVSVQLKFNDGGAGNAGLIVKVSDAGQGADQFNGYEVSIEPSGQLVLGRHRHNWEPLRRVPCDPPGSNWVTLAVRMRTNSLAVLVDGKTVTEYEDREHPLLSGTVGLRTWQREASFRNFAVRTTGETYPETAPKRSAPVPGAAASESIQRRETCNPLGLAEISAAEDGRAPGAVSGCASSGEAFKFEFAPDGQQAWGSGVSRLWRPVRKGTADGQFALVRENAFSGTQSQRLSFSQGTGEIGIENQGLNRWGMNFIQGKEYEGYLYACAAAPGEVFVALESRDGARVYAEKRLKVSAGNWQRLDFSLKPRESDPAGRFTIKLKQPGALTVGYAFLQSGEWGRFKGLPVRKDVAEGLINQGVKVLRYGGCMANAEGYRWKKMVGPRAHRPPYAGWWYPYSSNGWGIFDFLNFCEAAGFLAIPDVNANETPQDMADFIEYVNGPADSAWGRQRVADGHPKPYQLKYLEFGNEEQVNEAYWNKFKPVAEAIWAKDPSVILVVGDFAYNHVIKDPFNFTGADGRITSLSAQQKILQLAKQHNREVWFDVHVWTDGPRPTSSLEGMFSFIDALDRIADGAKHQVVVFELNANNHSQRRALANALALNAACRDGRLPIVTSANCLQPDGQNDNGWDQGLLFLNPAKVWSQPPGYVMRMLSRNEEATLVKSEVQDAGPNLDMAVLRSADGKRLRLQVVNLNEAPVAASLDLTGFVPAARTARVEELSGALAVANTCAAPERVTPYAFDWEHGLNRGKATYQFPPHSFTVIHLQ